MLEIASGFGKSDEGSHGSGRSELIGRGKSKRDKKLKLRSSGGTKLTSRWRYCLGS